MPAAHYDLTVEQGARFFIVFRWCIEDADHTPISLVGRTPYMKIERDGVILLSSGSTGGIDLDVEPLSSTGQINASISGVDTAKLMLPYGGGPGLEYELVLKDPGDLGNTVRLLQGNIKIHQEV